MRKVAALNVMEAFLFEDTARQEEIVQEMEKLQLEHDSLNETTRYIREFIDRIQGADDRIVTSPQVGTVRAQVTDIVEAMLRKHGPQHRKALLQMVEASGVIVGGQSPVSNMSAYLSRDKRFRSNGDGLWSIVQDN